MWVARDKDNTLWIFTKEKPIREEEQGIWYISEYIIDTSARLSVNLFPEVTWKSEPLEIYIVGQHTLENSIYKACDNLNINYNQAKILNENIKKYTKIETR